MARTDAWARPRTNAIIPIPDTVEGFGVLCNKELRLCLFIYYIFTEFCTVWRPLRKLLRVQRGRLRSTLNNSTGVLAYCASEIVPAPCPLCVPRFRLARYSLDATVCPGKFLGFVSSRPLRRGGLTVSMGRLGRLEGGVDASGTFVVALHMNC